MLQLIGWLGCLYLFVKGLEIASAKSGDLSQELRSAAVWLSLLGSVAFAVLFFLQFSGSRPLEVDDVMQVENVMLSE
ncbi:hypothetical protein G7076_05005 [Sphingomonas sp. HDW15A]|uniref:hypothetical protein n=1 Tax=Sphingomonas sp. HDW15A TaxID=2714942 RepID=UPI00140C43C4|nr:hypothetical protein [Sphingomonas sp. HDW15A]QIK95911.1 hypothetical protein G7076_05005 [Sphingomonas sp. HDW15A]